MWLINIDGSPFIPPLIPPRRCRLAVDPSYPEFVVPSVLRSPVKLLAKAKVETPGTPKFLRITKATGPSALDVRLTSEFF